MKKKMSSVLLCAAMTAGLLTGCGEYSVELPTESVEAEIFVQPIENLPVDFIKGADVSTVIAEEESGVKYYNQQGEEEDLLKILADSGVNYIRVRVWNNPYDEDENGYGGGNCDVDKAVTIGKRAAKYGMKLLVDFHYSDFWADPNKQYMPVAWRDKSLEEKAQLLYDFTEESLGKIIAGGADVGMVQIGNEINNGMSSEYKTEGIMTLLEKGSAAVRKVAEDKKKDIKIAVHYTGIDNQEQTYQYAKNLKEYGIDYDIFGVSYYAYWHGTMENMQEVLSNIKAEYGKETCVLETSYCYTSEDGDCSGNSIEGTECVEGYPVSVQGQATLIRDVMAYANQAGALGVFYWEPAWIPVGNDYDSNSKIWEEHGSGWASSFAGKYDAKDAGHNYGGCSWDNQAMFDFEGHALASLNVFKYVNYGATAPIQVLAYKDTVVANDLHQPVALPDEIQVIYNDPTKTDGMPVTWNHEDIDKVDVDTVGKYQVTGVTEDGTSVLAIVEVANTNYVKNPGFDDEDMDVWEVKYLAGDNCTDIQDKEADAMSGTKAFHFYSESDMEFTVEQSLEVGADGNYTFSANIQGGDVGNSADIYTYVKVGDKVYTSEKVILEGWQKWKNPTIENLELTAGTKVTVGFYVKAGAKGWGTMDDLEFFSIK